MRPAFLQLRSGASRDVAVAQEGWKLLVRFKRQEAVRTWLYNVGVDSGETVDVSSTYPIRAAYLFSLIEQQIEERGHSAAGNTKAKIPKELRKRLSALGYVD